MMRFTLMSSRSLAGFERFFRVFFRPSGFAVLLALIVFGHMLAFSGWRALAYGWDPSRVPFYSGVIYLLFLIASVIFHELGHLVVALHKGDLTAGIYVQFNSWQPMFMVQRRKDRGNIGINPVFDLAGILAQLLFASLLGMLFFLAGYDILPASVVLIDLGALMSLVLLPGSDGHKFLIDLLRDGPMGAGAEAKKPLRCGVAGYMPTVMAAFVLFYLIASLVLLMGINHQWLTGTIKSLAEGDSIISSAAQYAIAVAPGLMYFLSGLSSLSLIARSVKQQLSSSPPAKL